MGLRFRRRQSAADSTEARLGESEIERLWRQSCLIADGWRQLRLVSERGAVLMSNAPAAPAWATTPSMTGSSPI